MTYLYNMLFLFYLVLLSPSGINAVLTGHSYGATEEGIRELLEEWKLFFPQRFTTSSSSSNLPAAVEVVVGMILSCVFNDFVMVKCIKSEVIIMVGHWLKSQSIQRTFSYQI